MKRKKLGVILVILAVIFSVILIKAITSLNTEVKELGCFDNKGCLKIESTLSITNFAFGAIGFILALGFYLIIFAGEEDSLIDIIKNDKDKDSKDKKFEMLLKGLDNFEKIVIKAIKNQQGITQNTLRIRTDISKAKLSYVLQSLEKKELIKRVEKGKTLAIFLKENL